MSRILKVTYQAGPAGEPGKVSAELMSDGAEATEKAEVIAAGAFRAGMDYGERSWLVGMDLGGLDPAWSRSGSVRR